MMNSEKKDAIYYWVHTKDLGQLADILYSCIESLIVAEMVSVRLPDEDSEYPCVYWSHCGEELK